MLRKGTSLQRIIVVKKCLLNCLMQLCDTEGWVFVFRNENRDKETRKCFRRANKNKLVKLQLNEVCI